MVVEAWLGSFRWTGIVTSCEVDAARVWPQGWACMLLAYPNLYSTTEIYIEAPVEAYKTQHRESLVLPSNDLDPSIRGIASKDQRLEQACSL